jgi:hypothetical protein
MNAIANIKIATTFSESELLTLTAYNDAIYSISAFGAISVSTNHDIKLIEKSLRSIDQLCDQAELITALDLDDEYLPENMRNVSRCFSSISLLATFAALSIPNNPSVQLLALAFEKIRDSSTAASDLLAQLELEVVSS